MASLAVQFVGGHITFGEEDEDVRAVVLRHHFLCHSATLVHQQSNLENEDGALRGPKEEEEEEEQLYVSDCRL